jgi:hypothetical protein
VNPEEDMRSDLARYARAVAGAGFVVIWTTLGLVPAVLATAAALAAAAAPQLRAAVMGARRSRPPRHSRPRTRDLPLVPDDPSLVLTVGEF